MFEMWTLMEAVGLGYLGVMALADVRYRAVPGKWLVLGTVAASVYRVTHLEGIPGVWAGGIAIGVFFLLVSRLTGEGIGYGDSWLILILGIFLGVWRLLALLGIAFLLAAVASMWLLVRKKWSRKEAIPLVPFLLVGYLGSVVL